MLCIHRLSQQWSENTILLHKIPENKIFTHQMTDYTKATENGRLIQLISSWISVREVRGLLTWLVKSGQNGSPPLRRIFWSCVAQAPSRRDGHATRFTLRRNTASIMKI